MVRGALVWWEAVLRVGRAPAECGSAAPEFMRAKASDPPPPEPAPDVKRLVREKLDSVFTAASYPRQVRVSSPHHDLRGLGGTACVRAGLTSVMGKPLGTETYRASINGVV